MTFEITPKDLGYYFEAGSGRIWFSVVKGHKPEGFFEFNLHKI